VLEYLLVEGTFSKNNKISSLMGDMFIGMAGRIYE
jgi:hypothetical protein